MTLAAVARQWMAAIDIEWHRLRLWVAVFILELYVVLAYFILTPNAPAEEIRYLVYPLLWITVGAWAVLAVDPTPQSLAHGVFGAVIAGAYFLLVLWVPGNIALGTEGLVTDIRVAMYSPGWGPIVAVTSPWIRLFLVPFEVIGYAALAYLVYANVLELARGTLSGALGLVTCVGCTVPVLVPLVGLLGGPATSLTTTAYAWSYDLGTVFYMVTIGLLYRSYRQTTG